MYGVELLLFVGWRLYCKLSLVFIIESSISFIYLVDFFENRRRNRVQASKGISEEERERLGKINAEIGMTDRGKVHSSIVFKQEYW